MPAQAVRPLDDTHHGISFGYGLWECHGIDIDAEKPTDGFDVLAQRHGWSSVVQASTAELRRLGGALPASLRCVLRRHRDAPGV